MKRIILLPLFLLLGLVFVAAQNNDFKFSTWNIEWLSCNINGPSDDELQINNAVRVIKAMNSDVVALQEIGTSSAYATVDTLVRRLGNEWGGSILTNNNDNCSQNVALIYKKSRVEHVSTTTLTNAGTSYNWASRFPVRTDLRLTTGNTSVLVSFINIHAKAMGDESSYARRKAASESLKTLLDSDAYNTKNVVLLGDFNDYLVGTQCRSCSPSVSPYQNFMNDVANYMGITADLYDPYYNSPVIDNIIISNELFPNFANSVYRDIASAEVVSNFRQTTSDHYPITAHFTFLGSGGQSGCTNYSFSETFAQSLGQFTPINVVGQQQWNWHSLYGAMVSGYANATANVTENWLVSPPHNLATSSSATLSFDHALNYASNATDRMANHTVWVSDNYVDGLPNTATWTQMPIPNMPAGNNWTFINAGNISIPQNMLKQNVRVAFKYLSNINTAATWELKNFSLNAQCVTSSSNSQVATPESVVSVYGRNIRVLSSSEIPVRIYDISGRMLHFEKASAQFEYAVEHQGVYIVVCLDKVYKLLVQ